MAAITAAVIAGVGTAASVGMGAYQASQTPSGPGRNPTISKLPQDPVSQAMRGYEARTAIANENVLPPTFASALGSAGPGGMDPNAEKMPINFPGLSPLEEAQLGFTGPRGQQVPFTSAADVSAASAAGRSPTMTPAQVQYLAQQKAYQAHLAGQDPGPWAKNVNQTDRRLNQLQTRLGNVTQNAGDTPSPQEQARIDRINARIGRVTGRQTSLLGGSLQQSEQR